MMALTTQKIRAVLVKAGFPYSIKSGFTYTEGVRVRRSCTTVRVTWETPYTRVERDHRIYEQRGVQQMVRVAATLAAAGYSVRTIPSPWNDRLHDLDVSLPAPDSPAPQGETNGTR